MVSDSCLSMISAARQIQKSVCCELGNVSPFMGVFKCLHSVKSVSLLTCSEEMGLSAESNFPIALI